jgi:hypothetical protein
MLWAMLIICEVKDSTLVAVGPKAAGIWLQSVTTR